MWSCVMLFLSCRVNPSGGRGSSCGRLWFFSCRVVCRVELFLLCVFDMFLLFTPAGRRRSSGARNRRRQNIHNTHSHRPFTPPVHTFLFTRPLHSPYSHFLFTPAGRRRATGARERRRQGIHTGHSHRPFTPPPVQTSSAHPMHISSLHQ